MSWAEDRPKALARCTSCGHPYVVVVQEDDSIQKLGDVPGCPCGCDDLERLDPEDLDLV